MDKECQLPRLRRLPALALAAVLVALAASAALAFAQMDGGGTRVELRVWESAEDPSRNFVSARAEGGSWADLGTVPVTMDGVSASGVYRYGDLVLTVAHDEPLTPAEARELAELRERNAELAAQVERLRAENAELRARPTPTPTAAPTSAPSATPAPSGGGGSPGGSGGAPSTAAPTAAPTSAPSATPTPSGGTGATPTPTAAPSATATPTATPTPAPTIHPIERPPPEGLSAQCAAMGTTTATERDTVGHGGRHPRYLVVTRGYRVGFDERKLQWACLPAIIRAVPVAPHGTPCVWHGGQPGIFTTGGVCVPR